MDWAAFEQEIITMCIGCFFGGLAIGILLTLVLMSRVEKKENGNKRNEL